MVGMQYIIQPGEQYGRLAVLNEEPRRNGFRMWACQCSCGNRSVVYHHQLYTGKTVSCGCYGREQRAKANTKHGHNRRGRKSGEYISWWEMIQRCYRHSHIGYVNWGGRGVIVCDRWKHSFKNFLEDMGLKPTKRHWLDRIDTNGNYEPKNCRWATPKEQLRNTRRNRMVEYYGKSICLSELSEITGIRRSRLQWRFDNGWTVDEAISGG